MKVETESEMVLWSCRHFCSRNRHKNSLTHHLREEGKGIRHFPVEKKAEKKEEKNEEPSSAFFINPEAFVKQNYAVDGVDVGAIFLNFQRRSANVVNDSTAKMNIGNMDSFLAMNSIWNTEFQLKDLDSSTHKKIKEIHNRDRVAFTNEMTILRTSLDHEMESTGRIKSRSASDDFQEDIIHIYQTL
ncbi:hypothetical protein BGZ80_004898 [Entomortierella chlamydospora]|uniref:Uncharacterized protein n=1 Tax=Entomortierella chlamydospora TaxID=101097 RepID=A0A9P6SVT4_9FUNG|nr:hypothetical protein BGZ79_003570 [Entomortierella chlamydospora]KAG0007248.1 hypothetical protein BGZ80_004898 [Entomortierella chlamydospora]